ncbi:nuclear transport factor 2 family protein [candidate division KSB1 bacterium]|nr:nuclear transport factor 2 family protein [candidate division KSB1 bacterium]
MAILSATQLLEQWVMTFNRGDVEGAQKLYAPTAVQEEIGTGRKLKKEEIPAVFQGWRNAFPDAAGKVTRVIASRNEIFAALPLEMGTNPTVLGLRPFLKVKSSRRVFTIGILLVMLIWLIKTLV